MMKTDREHLKEQEKHLEEIERLSSRINTLEDLNGFLRKDHNSITQDYLTLLDEKQALIEELEESRKVIQIYSDPESNYWIEKTQIINGEKVHIIKNIVQLSKLAKDFLTKLSKK